MRSKCTTLQSSTPPSMRSHSGRSTFYLIIRNSRVWLQNSFPVQVVFFFYNCYCFRNRLFLPEEVILQIQFTQEDLERTASSKCTVFINTLAGSHYVFGSEQAAGTPSSLEPIIKLLASFSYSFSSPNTHLSPPDL